MTTDDAAPTIRRWLLPAELADDRPRRRTARDWTVDVALFAVAVFFWLDQFPTRADAADVGSPAMFIAVDPWLGAAACLSLWWRRRFPVALMAFMALVLVVTTTGIGAVLVALFNLAVHRDARPSVVALVGCLLVVVPYSVETHPEDMPPWMFASSVALMFVVPVTVGMTVRARRQLMVSLRRDAERQREEHRLRLADVRRAERQRIAREMHDVLAHRLSLLSVHAGALAYRSGLARDGAGPPMSPEEVDAASTVVRDSAATALVELGEVLTVLRDDAAGPDSIRPQPSLSMVDTLVAEAVEGGQAVRLRVTGDAPAAGRVPPQRQRTCYRIIQEGLTNARKHAPGAAVTVDLSVVDGDRIEVAVVNAVAPGTGPGDGAGVGLAGLAERVAIDGGTIAHGAVDGWFRLVARIPWRT